MTAQALAHCAYGAAGLIGEVFYGRSLEITDDLPLRQ